MGEIKVGTASWTDKTLISSGWYPPEADTPEKRLRFYARQFPLVEADSSYYALPAEQTAATWAERTPAGFTFNVKAFSLLTQHPTPVRALPADLRAAAGTSGKDRLYLKDVDPEVAEQAWDRFLAALEPLRLAGKLGAILLQFPPWFPISRANKEYIVGCAERVAPRRVCVEFRNRTWMTPDNQAETLEFLASRNLPYVCVDMPQGYRSSIPPVVAATSDLAVIRLHGHSDKWDSKDIHERFGYRYTGAELDEWAGQTRRLAADAKVTHVLFNNCYRDYAQVNARQLTELLEDARAPDEDLGRSSLVRDDVRNVAWCPGQGGCDMAAGIHGAVRRTLTFGVVALGCGVLSAPALPGIAAAQGAHGWPSQRVLLVGTYHGKAGQYQTIQSAVDAASPGDWILIAPGDYHENADEAGPQGDTAQGQMGGVYITKPGITLRGMNRNSVIVDGTKPGSAPCSSQPSAQDYGAAGPDGTAVGRNGILVWKANDVSVENLTVCNFLAGSGASGNQVWWNGGAGSGTIGLTGYRGSYLTATSTFFGGEATAAEYGIFAGNAAGPARWDQLYASNMNDSGTYVGACLRQCDVTLDHMWMENNALGYSGTNSGGTVIIENSQFDDNQDGLDTNSAVIGDPPAPQDGRCADGRTSPVTRTTSCWVVMHNYIHDNNNPSAPAAGSAAAGPVGTGMTISGGRFDTVMDNVISGNGAWGVLFVPYAQQGTPSLGQTCSGAGGNEVPGFGCVLDPEGNALLHNTFRHNGYFGNPSNSDFGQITFFGNEPQNCFAANHAPDGSAPADLQQTQPACGITTTAGNKGGDLFAQLLCDTGLGPCPPGATYPKPNGTVILKPLPRGLRTMPDPCAGVPANPWCPGR